MRTVRQAISKIEYGGCKLVCLLVWLGEGIPFLLKTHYYLPSPASLQSHTRVVWRFRCHGVLLSWEPSPTALLVASLSPVSESPNVVISPPRLLCILYKAIEYFCDCSTHIF